MEESQLRDIISQVLSEMNVSGSQTTSSNNNFSSNTNVGTIENGVLPDITKIDIRTQ